MDNMLAKNLIPLAMPEDDNQAKFFMEKIRDVVYERLMRDVYVFDLNYSGTEYAVTLLAQNNFKPWMLAFNRKYSSTQRPLVLKVYSGFKIGKFYSVEERRNISDFFGIDLTKKGSFVSLFTDISDGLVFRRDGSTDIESRTVLLSLQDQPEEINKIYFKGFKQNKKIRQDGTPSTRTIFNSWKTQTLLPWIWEQIKSDPSISVIYTTESEAVYKYPEEERQLFQQKLGELLKR